MGADVQVVSATPAHAEALAPLLRPADVAEVEASAGFTPLEALQASLSASERAWALVVGGEVAALWGVVPVGQGTLLTRPQLAVVWALTGRAVDRHRKLFVRLSRGVLSELLRLYPVLVNAVDARYRGALRWVRWLGAEVAPAVPFGALGLPFHPIRFRRT